MTRDARPDWVAWHGAYEDESSDLSRRLEIVTGRVADALESTDRSPVRVISMCSGQARDLRAALERVARRDLVGRLVELDPSLAEDARVGLRALGAAGLDVIVGDAGDLSAYDGAAPADLVLACGIFGNVSDADVERTVRALPMLCATGATVIWTRHRREPDLNVSIRRWLTELGFQDVGVESVEGPGRLGAVGTAIFRGTTMPLERGRLFTFDDEMAVGRD